MTTFMYAMGFTPFQLLDLQMAPKAFTRFFEAPQINSIRVVNRQGYAAGHQMVRFVKAGPYHNPITVSEKATKARVIALSFFPFDSQTPPPSILSRLNPFYESFTAAKVLGKQLGNGLLFKLLRRKLQDVSKKNSELAPLIDAVTATEGSFGEYCYSLLFDLGLFTGVEVRRFLKDQLEFYLSRKSSSSASGLSASPLRSADVDRWSVGQFAGDTGVEVAFAATNLTTGLGTYFRAARDKDFPNDTSDFPVLDAVAISSAFPFAFKPYAVFDRKNVPNGYWTDGGVQNNLPLHAFDSSADTPLAPGMLGIRLEASSQIVQEFVEDLKSLVDVSVPGFLLSYVSSLLSTAMYPTEGGQIRTPQEKAQTVEIKIPAEVLSTLSFAPKRANAERAILIAFDAVAKYFVPGFDADRLPDAAGVSAEEKSLLLARSNLRSSFNWVGSGLSGFPRYILEDS